MQRPTQHPPAGVHSPLISRRESLLQAGGGFGAIALASLLHDDGALASDSDTSDVLTPKQPHFLARAKRVIYLFMHGGPSHVDLFDPKPDLIRYAGKPLPDSLLGDQRRTAPFWRY